MKERVSVDECIECLQEYISKGFNTELAQDAAKSALELLIINIDRLKRLDENVKKKIKEYKEKENAENSDIEYKVTYAKIWRVLESLYK